MFYKLPAKYQFLLVTVSRLNIHFVKYDKLSKGNKVITFRENRELNDSNFKERIEAIDFNEIYEREEKD